MSICDRCIHSEVCGLVDNHEEEIAFCSEIMPKMGHWIDREEYDADRWKCSECGRTVLWKEKFCPNCGAKMEDTE